MGNVNMEASQINYRGGEKKMSVEEALKNTSGEAAAIAQLQTDVLNLNSNKANQITIAPFFSAEASYDPGDLVYYNGLSYRCVNAHEGEWDADDFAATTIANELDALKNGLIDLNGYKANRLKGSMPKNDTATVDITDLGNTIGMIVCTTYRSYALYTFKAETSNLYVQKVADSGTYPPTITAVDADTLSIANTDTGASGQYLILA